MVVASYFLRCVMWSLRVMFGVTVADVVFAIFGYWEPELVPLIIQLIIINRDLLVVTAARDFKYDLYESMTDTETYPINDRPNVLTYQTKTSSGEIQRVQVRFTSEDTATDEDWTYS